MQNFYINGRFLTQPVTGVQRFAWEISLNLAKLDQNIHFLTPNNIITTDKITHLQLKKFGRFTGHFWEHFELQSKIEKEGLLINLGNTGPLFFSNQVITIHDLAFLKYPEWFTKKFIAYYNFLIPKLIRKSRKVFTVSKFTKKELIECFNIASSKIEVIYNAPASIFVKQNEIKKKRTILFVGSIDPRKNLPNLIKAFLSLKQLPEYDLMIVGKKNQRIFNDQLLSKTNYNHPNIKFTGYLSDEELVKQYNCAEIFVFPTFYEGFGIPPLEAQACEMPVIVSDILPHRETFGDSALYCDPNNYLDIADKISYLLGNKDQQEIYVAKGKENVKRFNSLFSAQKLYDTLISL